MTTVIASIFLLLGAGIAVIAGVGILRFDSAFARFHAAGKASPIAFLAAAVGAGLELGPAGAALLLIAAAAMTLTLPFGVHLLFRAVHRTTETAATPTDRTNRQTNQGDNES